LPSLKLKPRNLVAMIRLQQAFEIGEIGFGSCLQGTNPEPLMSALGQKQKYALQQFISVN
jgi:hypothetical protein